MTLAQTTIGNFNGIGPLGNTSAPNTHYYTSQFTNVISNIIGVMTVFAGIWFVFQLFIGAIGWLSSGSDKQGVENAKKRLQNAFVGLLLVVISYSLIAIVGVFLGIDILDLQTLLKSLSP